MSGLRVASTHRSMRRAVAAMFSGLRAAEELSRDIAGRQAALAQQAKMRRFFEHQAAQEAVHAGIFDISLRLLAPHARCPDRLASALAKFRARLDADLRDARLGDSIVGLQGVFEALGEVALRPAQGGIAAFASRFVPLRSVLFEQERMHQRYGRYWLMRIAATDERVRSRLAQVHAEYIAHGENLLAASIEIFDAFPLDQHRYLADGLAAIRSLDDGVCTGGPARASTN